MKSLPPARTTPLSLQDKLDHISYERDVLAIRRDLARHGLHEGDSVRHLNDGVRGRVVVIARSGTVPYSAVETDTGGELPFDYANWSLIRR